MASGTASSDRLRFAGLARGLSMAGLVLAGLYITILAGSLFPIQLLNPAWQLKIGSALINASPFPLLGLALLHLGPIIDPDDPLLASRQRLAARLAVAVSLGFLLPTPRRSGDCDPQGGFEPAGPASVGAQRQQTARILTIA